MADAPPPVTDFPSGLSIFAECSDEEGSGAAHRDENLQTPDYFFVVRNAAAHCFRVHVDSPQAWSSLTAGEAARAASAAVYQGEERERIALEQQTTAEELELAMDELDLEDGAAAGEGNDAPAARKLDSVHLPPPPSLMRFVDERGESAASSEDGEGQRPRI